MASLGLRGWEVEAGSGGGGGGSGVNGRNGNCGMVTGEPVVYTPLIVPRLCVKPTHAHSHMHMCVHYTKPHTNTHPMYMYLAIVAGQACRIHSEHLHTL